MPIVDIQRRFRELGRIRTGKKELTGNTYKKGPRMGEPIERPAKIPAFRLTSPWPHLIEQAAAVFGGDPRPWDNDGKPEFEVFTTSVDANGHGYLPCVIPPGEILDQWYELWSGGGCSRRCDGVRQVLVDRPCSCPNDPLERQELAGRGDACKPTTRLRVMLPDVSDVGIWRLESHGFHAAAELGGAAGLVEAATRSGALIPADLRLEPREGSRRPGEQRKKFFVPAISFRGQLGQVLDALGILEAGSDTPRIAGVEPRPAITTGGSPALPPGGSSFDPRPTDEASFPGPQEPPPPPSDRDEPPAPPPEPDEPEGFAPPPARDEHAPPAPPEPAAFTPPPAEPEPGSERAYSGPQVIAMRFDDRGVKDRALKLRMIQAMIGREISSAKDLTTAEIRQVLEDLNDDLFVLPDVELEADDTDSGPSDEGTKPEEGQVTTETEILVPEIVSGPGSSSSSSRRRPIPEPPSPVEHFPDEWTGEEWRALLADRSVKVTELMRAAASAAADRGIEVPGSLDELAASGLAEELLGFVEVVSLERRS